MNLRARVGAGDRAALAEAFTLYRAFAAKVIRGRGRRGPDVDDLIQEAFIRLPICCRKCRPSTSLAGCVVTAALQASDNLRTDRPERTSSGPRGPRTVRPGAARCGAVPAPVLDPEAALQQREEVDQLGALVLRLPPCERRLLVAVELEGLTNAETAAREGVKLASVANITYRARRRLEQLVRRDLAQLPQWAA